MPATDDCHQLERALFHGLRASTTVVNILGAVRAVIKVFRKADILAMQLKLANCQSLKVFCATRWCEGAVAALQPVLDGYAVITPALDNILDKRQSTGNDPHWDNVHKYWRTIYCFLHNFLLHAENNGITLFLQVLAGLLDIMSFVCETERILQRENVAFDVRDAAIRQLEDNLKSNVDDGARYWRVTNAFHMQDATHCKYAIQDPVVVD